MFDEVITNDTPSNYSRKAQEEEGKRERMINQFAPSYFQEIKSSSTRTKNKFLDQLILPLILCVGQSRLGPRGPPSLRLSCDMHTQHNEINEEAESGERKIETAECKCVCHVIIT